MKLVEETIKPGHRLWAEEECSPDRCYDESPDVKYYCLRSRDHKGHHLAHASQVRAVAAWGDFESKKELRAQRDLLKVALADTLEVVQKIRRLLPPE